MPLQQQIQVQEQLQLRPSIRFNLEKSKAQLRLLTDFNLHQLLLAVYAEQDRRDKEWGIPTGEIENEGYLKRRRTYISTIRQGENSL